MMLIIVSIMTSTFIEPRRHKRDSKYSVHFSIDTRVKGLPCKSQTQGEDLECCTWSLVLNMHVFLCISLLFLSFVKEKCKHNFCLLHKW